MLWERLILSDSDHEHLVSELYYGGQFLLLMDREQGRAAVCVSFPDKTENLALEFLCKSLSRNCKKPPMTYVISGSRRLRRSGNPACRDD